MAENGNLVAQLVSEYSTALESPTILAIASDHDLTDPAQNATARHILDFAKENAARSLENFIAHGSCSAHSEVEQHGGAASESVGARSPLEWKPQADNTSQRPHCMTEDFQSFELFTGHTEAKRDDSWYQTYGHALDGLDDKGKETTLVGMFPALTAYDIRHTLKKCEGDVGLAIDELMTQSFLEESGDRQRGIEGFAATAKPYARTKGKRSKAQGSSHSSDINRGDSGLKSRSSMPSTWDIGKQNIEFLSRTMDMPRTQIAALYHQKSASLVDTIVEIIEANHADAIVPKPEDDAVIQVNAFQLNQDFPSVPIKQIESICQITHPKLNNARELIQVLAQSSNPRSRSSSNGCVIQIQIQHTPPLYQTSTSATSPLASNPTPLPTNERLAAATAAEILEARNTAFNKATVAYRRGKSDPLMGAVAAYYAEEGRVLNKRAKTAQRAVTEARIARQSSCDELDLHGACVRDAVSIAREQVTAWWHERGLGDGRHRFTIVTGTGMHSEGGKLKIGPAVTKMLIKEGWKVEFGTGKLFITGVVGKS